MPAPSNMDLYQKVKEAVMRAIPQHSAYRSGLIVQKYKKEFSEKYPDKSPYIGKRPQKVGLSRWFKEEWKNQRGNIGYKYKSDVYRPTRRVTKKTPTTFGELKKGEVKRARSEKYRKGHVNRFKKPTKKSNKWSDKYKKSIDCNNPKGFSQKQHCKYGRNKTRKNRL